MQPCVFFRVEDLTKVWQEIVEHPKVPKQGNYQPFVKYYSRINVAEMSGINLFDFDLSSGNFQNYKNCSVSNIESFEFSHAIIIRV